MLLGCQSLKSVFMAAEALSHSTGKGSGGDEHPASRATAAVRHRILFIFKARFHRVQVKMFKVHIPYTAHVSIDINAHDYIHTA